MNSYDPFSAELFLEASSDNRIELKPWAYSPSAASVASAPTGVMVTNLCSSVIELWEMEITVSSHPHLITATGNLLKATKSSFTLRCLQTIYTVYLCHRNIWTNRLLFIF